MKYYALEKTQDMKQQVIKRDEMELLHIHLKAGESVPNHKIPGVGTAIVLNGEVKFSNESSDALANMGDIVQFEPNEVHAVEAMKESDIYVYRQRA